LRNRTPPSAKRAPPAAKPMLEISASVTASLRVAWPLLGSAHCATSPPQACFVSLHDDMPSRPKVEPTASPTAPMPSRVSPTPFCALPPDGGGGGDAEAACKAAGASAGAALVAAGRCSAVGAAGATAGGAAAATNGSAAASGGAGVAAGA